MVRLIKRYGSRKLYDTEESRYVLLEDIAAWIRQGQEVRVIDNKTAEDVTAQTLTQIISEEGRRGTAFLPNDMLHEIIRMGQDAVSTGVERLQHGVGRFVQASIDRLRAGPPGAPGDGHVAAAARGARDVPGQARGGGSATGSRDGATEAGRRTGPEGARHGRQPDQGPQATDRQEVTRKRRMVMSKKDRRAELITGRRKPDAWRSRAAAKSGWHRSVPRSWSARRVGRCSSTSSGKAGACRTGRRPE